MGATAAPAPGSQPAEASLLDAAGAGGARSWVGPGVKDVPWCPQPAEEGRASAPPLGWLPSAQGTCYPAPPTPPPAAVLAKTQRDGTRKGGDGDEDIWRPAGEEATLPLLPLRRTTLGWPHDSPGDRLHEASLGGHVGAALSPAK